MGTLVISKKENNKYKYTYNNRKGNTLLTSNSHETKAHCISEINILKRNFSSIEYVRYKTPSGKLYFKISVNGHLLGSSRKFTTPLLMEKGLNDFSLILQYLKYWILLKMFLRRFPKSFLMNYNNKK